MSTVRFVASCALFIAVMCVILTFGFREGVAWDCRSYKAATGREAKMVGMYCFIKAKDGEWYRLDERMLRNVTQGE